MTERNLEGVTQLGSGKTTYRMDNPGVDILETFENQHQDLDYVISFKCPEFSSLCPKTSQPDFATIRIQYIPNRLCVESKSLKLYLFAYRNHGAFHEDCVNKIMRDIKDKISPKWIRVEGQFRPRGGISIVPIVEYTELGYKQPEYTKVKINHDMTVG